MSNSFVDELKWRGLLSDKTHGIEEQLNKELTAAYIGFDPTSDSLHVGNLVPVILLSHFQRFGHKPVILVGGATGMVGDPSGKSKERNLLAENTLNFNLKKIEKQFSKFLDFDTTKPNCAEVVNNYDWFKSINFLSFIRDVGKFINVGYMLAKDSVKNRLNSESGFSFTEFTYQLLQAYDYLFLHENKNCRLQMGGSDQWGNITTGIELIRKKLNKEAHALTCPLLTKIDGSKFGKSEQGNIWLDPDKTSPFLFYQFWLNSTDEDAKRLIKIFTFLDETTISELLVRHLSNPDARELQKKLAKELTVFVHGQQEFEKVVYTSNFLFDSSIEEIEKVDEFFFSQITKNINQYKISVKNINEGILLLDFLFQSGIFSSKSEAKKMLINGGIFINKRKISSIDHKIDSKDVLFKRYILLQKGKKNYCLICVEN